MPTTMPMPGVVVPVTVPGVVVPMPVTRSVPCPVPIPV
jgi:hypothetical protein